MKNDSQPARVRHVQSDRSKLWGGISAVFKGAPRSAAEKDQAQRAQSSTISSEAGLMALIGL